MEEIHFGEVEHESAMDLLRNEAEHYREYIDQEFTRETGNTWPNCVLSRLAAMMAFLDMSIEDEEISPEESEKLLVKLRQALSYARDMQKKYTSVDAEIPTQEKEEMLSMLDIFKS